MKINMDLNLPEAATRATAQQGPIPAPLFAEVRCTMCTLRGSELCGL